MLLPLLLLSFLHLCILTQSNNSPNLKYLKSTSPLPSNLHCPKPHHHFLSKQLRWIYNTVFSLFQNWSSTKKWPWKKKYQKGLTYKENYEHIWKKIAKQRNQNKTKDKDGGKNERRLFLIPTPFPVLLPWMKTKLFEVCMYIIGSAVTSFIYQLFKNISVNSVLKNKLNFQNWMLSVINAEAPLFRTKALIP